MVEAAKKRKEKKRDDTQSQQEKALSFCLLYVHARALHFQPDKNAFTNKLRRFFEESYTTRHRILLFYFPPLQYEFIRTYIHSPFAFSTLLRSSLEKRQKHLRTALEYLLEKWQNSIIFVL